MEDLMQVVISTIITGVGAILATSLGIVTRKVINYLNEKEVSQQTKDIIKTAVRATEQLYKDIHGKEKLAKAKECALELLESKGIEISDTELNLAIHDVVLALNENKQLIFDELLDDNIDGEANTATLPYKPNGDIKAEVSI